MTIARDIRTGAVVGQYAGQRTEHLDATGRLLYVSLRLLTGRGWKSVPETFVRLEEISDR